MPLQCFCHNVNAMILGCKVCVKSEKMQYWNKFGEYFGIASSSKWGNILHSPRKRNTCTCTDMGHVLNLLTDLLQ